MFFYYLLLGEIVVSVPSLILAGNMRSLVETQLQQRNITEYGEMVYILVPSGEEPGEDSATAEEYH